MKQTDNTDFTVKRMLGLSLDWWNNATIISLAIAAFAAIAVGICTFCVVKLQNAEKIEYERFKLDAATKVAQLQNQAEEARLKTEKIKQVLAWRNLSLEQSINLEKALAANPGSVNLRYTDGDPEALYLAIQLSQIFAKAHWQVAPGSLKPANTIVFGILLQDAADKNSQIMKESFASAKVPFSTGSIPTEVASFGVTEISGAPILMIGSKTPPKLP